MPFRHIKTEADLIAEHLYESVLLQTPPDAKFLRAHAEALLSWVQYYELNGTPYQFQPHPSQALESSRRVLPPLELEEAG